MNIIQSIVPHPKNYLTATELSEIDHEISILETREAAGIEALKIIQAHRGWISDDSLHAIAQYLKMSSADLEGVATFYNLIYRQPVGRYVIHLCDSVSCHLTGYSDVLAAIKAYLAIDYGQTSSDGLFTLLSNACLGGCDKSPVMMIGKQHYQQLTPERAVEVLQELKNEASLTNGAENLSGEANEESDNAGGAL